MTPIRAALPAALVLALALPAAAHDAGHPGLAQAQAFAAEELQIADARVVDQTGAPRSFAEVMGDGPVVVTFIYASCTTVCPVANGLFQIVQGDLDARGDSETRLVSVTVDPLRDTPEALRRVAETFGAGDRWTFVTGSVPEIAGLLRSFGLSPGAVEDHDPVFLVGRGDGNAFVRVLGLPAPETLIDLVETQRADPGA